MGITLPAMSAIVCPLPSPYVGPEYTTLLICYVLLLNVEVHIHMMQTDFPRFLLHFHPSMWNKRAVLYKYLITLHYNDCIVSAIV